MSGEKEVVAYEPSTTMKDVLGDSFKLEEHFTKELIKECKALIQEASDTFFQDAAADLQALEQAVKEAEGISQQQIETLQIHTYNIRGMAKVLGFSLITEICVHLVATLHTTKLSDKKRLALLRKLVEALRIAFDQRIRDDGGAVGMSLLTSLRKALPKKIRPARKARDIPARQ